MTGDIFWCLFLSTQNVSERCNQDPVHAVCTPCAHVRLSWPQQKPTERSVLLGARTFGSAHILRLKAELGSAATSLRGSSGENPTKHLVKLP